MFARAQRIFSDVYIDAKTAGWKISMTRRTDVENNGVAGCFLQKLTTGRD